MRLQELMELEGKWNEMQCPAQRPYLVTVKTCWSLPPRQLPPPCTPLTLISVSQGLASTQPL